MSNRRSQNLLRNLGLLAASTLLSLLLAECVVRIVCPQQLAVWHTMRDGLVIHPPGLVTYLADFKQEVRFNANGMRDREHVARKPEGTTRILVLGDSYMEALQVAFGESFPSLLESGLREKLKRNVEVINCGVSGWGQDDQLAYLTKYGLAYAPDLILVAMTLHNDVLDNMRERFHTLAHDRLFEKPAARMSEREFRVLQLKGFFASHSQLWQLLRKLKSLGEMRMLATDLDRHVAQLIGKGGESQQLERGWALTFKLFNGIRDAGKSIGAETAVMLIPLKLQLQDDTLDAFRAVAGMSAGEVDIDKPQRAMTAFGRTSGIGVIDLLPALRNWTVENRTAASRKSLHLKEGHWNNLGHRLAADIAVKAIIGKDMLNSNVRAQFPAFVGQRP
jgi:hypothetical protein